MKRASGILLPISSLPSNYGIGCFSKEAFTFIDRLVESGQSYWQILPVGPTGYGDSPYQTFSTFAGNPYFIDLEALIELQWLTKEECDACDFVSNINYVEYEKIYLSRFRLLRTAFERSKIQANQAFISFCSDNAKWLDDYSLFMAVKGQFDNNLWTKWDRDIAIREEKAIKKYQDMLVDDITFFKFQQYLFFEQWNKLKNYANKNGIKIIGDVPIYVAFDSADAWSQPKLLQFDEEGGCIGVAGCPPDGFSKTGQLWGNPLYDWKYHEKTNFAWWVERIAHAFLLYDVVRIDHFRGFDEYYAIPFGEETAVNGAWERGPGMKLFYKLNEIFGSLPIIAEDLGFLTKSVYRLLEESGFPGMKVLQFAFDDTEDSTYLPHKYDENCVVYTGTHDNDTTLGWYRSLNNRDRSFVNEYLGIEATCENPGYKVIRAALMSKAALAIVPLQDYLNLGSEARINTPSTFGNNWKWRCSKDSFSKELCNKIKRMTRMYSR